MPVVGGGAPGSVVQGADTGHTGDHVPGVDMDMVAASMSEMSRDQVTMSQPGPKQLGKSLAGVLSGAAQNIKSKFVNIGVTGPLVARSSPSPPDTAKTAGKAVRQVPIRVESSGGSGVGEKSPHSIPLTVPGAE